MTKMDMYETHKAHEAARRFYQYTDMGYDKETAWKLAYDEVVNNNDDLMTDKEYCYEQESK